MLLYNIFNSMYTLWGDKLRPVGRYPTPQLGDTPSPFECWGVRLSGGWGGSELEKNYCEFYTQTPNGTLYFDSYAKTISGKELKIASPAKHKFLQRRQYRRVKFIHDLDLNFDGGSHKITTLDISAGGMKFNTDANIDIEKEYTITIPLSEKQSVECIFCPIRIEKRETGGYTLSGRFDYHNSTDKMTLTQFCAKRSIEIRNK